ncbi:hypothetical protein BT63DRAFT_436575 [Microthyrium microscopicum]|uniref:Uncharacterized protein n=1 Tax=Microthyrium microscopicum TaxID=703497 RepID=A0A6A6UKB9_9PEZI|nr:hypothetical protein BT63DRAFT_436575 [Microthyrium microscopicum]
MIKKEDLFFHPRYRSFTETHIDDEGVIGDLITSHQHRRSRWHLAIHYHMRNYYGQSLANTAHSTPERNPKRNLEKNFENNSLEVSITPSFSTNNDHVRDIQEPAVQNDQYAPAAWTPINLDGAHPFFHRGRNSSSPWYEEPHWDHILSEDAKKVHNDVQATWPDLVPFSEITEEAMYYLGCGLYYHRRVLSLEQLKIAIVTWSLVLQAQPLFAHEPFLLAQLNLVFERAIKCSSFPSTQSLVLSSTAEPPLFNMLDVQRSPSSSSRTCKKCLGAHSLGMESSFRWSRDGKPGDASYRSVDLSSNGPSEDDRMEE